jgi:hypothetical protein
MSNKDFEGKDFSKMLTIGDICISMLAKEIYDLSSLTIKKEEIDGFLDLFKHIKQKCEVICSALVRLDLIDNLTNQIWDLAQEMIEITGTEKSLLEVWESAVDSCTDIKKKSEAMCFALTRLPMIDNKEADEEDEEDIGLGISNLYGYKLRKSAIQEILDKKEEIEEEDLTEIANHYMAITIDDLLSLRPPLSKENILKIIHWMRIQAIIILKY